MVSRMPPLMSDVMTAGLLSVAADCPINEAAQIMSTEKVRYLAVSDDSGFISILALEDIQRITAPAHASEQSELLVADICPPRAHMADVEDPLPQVLQTMADQAVNAVLVMQDGDLAGIFTTSDACRLLAEQLIEAAPTIIS